MNQEIPPAIPATIFCLLFAAYKYKDQNIQNYRLSRCFYDL